MKIRIFIADNILANMILTGTHHHYLTSVLRIKLESNVFLFNKDGEYLFSVDLITKKNISLNLIEKIEKIEIPSGIIACLPFIKPDTLSRMVRQSVEMSAEYIYIFNSNYSSVRFINLERINLIAIEAIEQCGRIMLPKISFFNSLEELIKNIDCEIIYANEKTASCENLFLDNFTKKYQNVGVIIGPEGGFSNIELEILNAFTAVNLGQFILRSDTALVNMLLLAKMLKNRANPQ